MNEVGLGTPESTRLGGWCTEAGRPSTGISGPRGQRMWLLESRLGRFAYS